MRVTDDVLAPANTSISASAASPRSAAQCNALMPSPCAAFTSAPSLISCCTALRSPRAAASATGETLCAPIAAAITTAIINARNDCRFIIALRLGCGRRRNLRDRLLAGAVAERLDVFHAEAVREREEHVRHRRCIGGLDVEVALQQAVAVSQQDQRAAAIVVDVRIRHRRSPDHQRLLEQVAVAFLRFLEAIEEIRQQADAELVD